MKLPKISRFAALAIVAAVAALALPAVTLTATPRPRPGPAFLIGLLPTEVQQTLEALHAYQEALVETAGASREEAQAHVESIRGDAIAYFVAVDSILTPSQKTQILTALGDFRRMSPSERRQAVSDLFAGVDVSALESALRAVKEATPETRPDAVEAAVRIAMNGILPVIDERLGTSELQRRALDRARQTFWNASRPDRVALSVLRSENHATAFASLTP
jgi:hypothetical protein